MLDLNHMMIATVLAVILPNYIIPEVIYLMCEAILQMDGIMQRVQEGKDDHRKTMVVRLFYLISYLFVWGILLVLFIPMMFLVFVEKLGGFIEADIKEAGE